MGKKRIIVIGGVAAGTSAASQAKRRLPEAEVVLLERGPYVSYGACGIPYVIGDAGRDLADLVVVSPERFRDERGIDVRLRTEATHIDTARRVVTARSLDADRTEELAYDELVIATGASAARPPLPGIDLPGVLVLRELVDGELVQRALASGARRAAIIGAGYIGLEMAEALVRRGLEVTVLEKADQVVPGFDATIADRVAEVVRAHGVRLELGRSVTGFEQVAEGLVVGTDGGPVEADVVLVAVGVRPNVSLARDAGIALGPTGAIATDDRMRTNVHGVFAAGDCAEAFHRITGRPTWIPLGTTANKQGKVAGANAAGADERFHGVLGTAGFCVFELEVARTGLGTAELGRVPGRVVRSVSTQASRAHDHPGAAPITTVLFVDPDTKTLLGAQMVGAGTVAKRIDVLATAMLAGMTVQEVGELDLAYAPPFSPVYDPILIAATVAVKDLKKRNAGRAAAE